MFIPSSPLKSNCLCRCLPIVDVIVIFVAVGVDAVLVNVVLVDVVIVDVIEDNDGSDDDDDADGGGGVCLAVPRFPFQPGAKT